MEMWIPCGFYVLPNSIDRPLEKKKKRERKSISAKSNNGFMQT